MNIVKSKELTDKISLLQVSNPIFKNNYMAVKIALPLEKKSVTKNALLPLVLSSATKNYDTTQKLERKMEELYDTSVSANQVKCGEKNILSFNVHFIKDKYLPEKIENDAIDLLFEVMLNPLAENGAFSEKYVSLQKNVLKEIIQSEINDKAKYAMNELIKNMFEGEAYAIPSNGYLEDVDPITSKELYEHYVDILNNAKFDVILAGDFNLENVKSKIKANLEKYGNKDFSLPKETVKKESEFEKITKSMDIVQGKLAIGYTTNRNFDSEDYIPLMLGVNLLGGGAHSKLFNNVREKHSICYYCSASLIGYKGAMIINSGIEHENEQKAMELINTEVEDVKLGNITDIELENAKKAFINKMIELTDNLSSIGEYYYSLKISGQKYTIEELLENIKNCTKEDIVKSFSDVKLDTEYFLTK